MEHLQRDIKATKNVNPVVRQYENEEAGNAYLMAVVAIVAGLPLPVINIIASLIYLLSKRKASYYIRWHALQALLAQFIVIPFNSVAVGWAIYYIKHKETPGLYFGIYIFLVLLFNLTEFVAVLITAVQVKKGKNARWFGISNITDKLCSTENRDPYTL